VVLEPGNCPLLPRSAAHGKQQAYCWLRACTEAAAPEPHQQQQSCVSNTAITTGGNIIVIIIIITMTYFSKKSKEIKYNIRQKHNTVLSTTAIKLQSPANNEIYIKQTKASLYLRT